MHRKPCPNRAGCAGIWAVLAALNTPLWAILMVCVLLFFLAFFCAL